MLDATNRLPFCTFHPQRNNKFVCLSILLGLYICTLVVANDLYDYSTSSVIKLDPSNFKSRVIDSSETWLVEFYAPWCGHCRNLAPAWNKAARRLRGVAKVGAVNADEHQSLAQQYGIRGFPTIKIFKGMGRKARKPEDYQGQRSAGAIVSYAKNVMPSFVAKVKESGLEAFFKDEKYLPHVLLFTDKKETSPLYKGLSATFANKIAFGEVRKAEAGSLLSKYEISSFPTLLTFKANASPTDESTRYGGAMDPESLTKFLTSVAENAPPPPESDVGKKEEIRFKQPDAFKGDIGSISSSKEYEELCGKRPDNRMCGLAVLPGGTSHELHSSLKDIANQFKFDNLAITSIDASSEYGTMLGKAFGADLSKGGFLVVRSGKPKYSLMSQESKMAVDKIKSFLDNVVSGNVRYSKLQEELPRYEAPKDPATEEETGQSSDKEGRNTSKVGSSAGGSCNAASSKTDATCNAKEEL